RVHHLAGIHPRRGERGSRFADRRGAWDLAPREWGDFCSRIRVEGRCKVPCVLGEASAIYGARERARVDGAEAGGCDRAPLRGVGDLLKEIPLPYGQGCQTER